MSFLNRESITEPSRIHICVVICWLAMLHSCNPVMVALADIPGAWAIKASTVSWAGSYDVPVAEEAVPAIVPPVATMVTLGFWTPHKAGRVQMHRVARIRYFFSDMFNFLIFVSS